MQTQSIGVDVGKTELVASIRDSDGNSAMPALFPNSILGFKKFLVYLYPNFSREGLEGQRVVISLHF